MLAKICGLTTPEAAKKCLELGADMIGMIYYPPSPRHIELPQIRAILDITEPFRSLGRKTVLVVVNTLPEEIDSRIDFVQLHGSLQETDKIPCRTIRVIKNYAAFQEQLNKTPSAHRSESPNAPQFLLEMSSGILPGGNGAAWDWSMAKPFCKKFPTILAGGVTPKNVRNAIAQAKPLGIDVSSGVEISPGVKDFDKVRQLLKRCFS
ncbi:MAG: phosphoribosylanthranilate isomerase [Planctomycetaceae bacterium]|jgi:phosphoribosylanthranilate isomerase/indole-3-glycerol phosphate synthase/phosphoribosylanthranilate isomerase|nr:phosphoribosylanthranilate isomerase [Planctomycetaceae bacterium]